MTDKLKDSKPFAGLVPGRIVWYWPADYEARISASEHAPGPWPAMVTAVMRDREEDGSVGEPTGLVTLNINVPRQLPVGVDPVKRLYDVPYHADREPGGWSWMFEGQGTRYASDPPAALPQLDKKGPA